MKRIIITALLATMIWTGYRTEIDFGRVLNNDGDGKLYNGESYYNYIAYPEQYKENDIVMTVCLLNPLNNAEDDIIIRHDVRLFKDI
jgi:hypothetical protein